MRVVDMFRALWDTFAETDGRDDVGTAVASGAQALSEEQLLAVPGTEDRAPVGGGAHPRIAPRGLSRGHVVSKETQTRIKFGIGERAPSESKRRHAQPRCWPEFLKVGGSLSVCVWRATCAGVGSVVFRW